MIVYLLKLVYTNIKKAKEIMIMITLTLDNFKEYVLDNNKPVLVDFWASWCGPCQMQAPVLDEIDKELVDVVVGKVNVDEQMDLASKYRILSIPTILIFKNGECVSTNVGVQSKQELLSKINRL